MAQVEIRHDGTSAHIFIDGKEVPFVRSYTLHQEVRTEIPEAILELNLADHKNSHSFENADVRYSEETIRQAVIVLRSELLEHDSLYSAFLESIKSVFNESDAVKCSVDEISKRIVDRIIGDE